MLLREEVFDWDEAGHFSIHSLLVLSGPRPNKFIRITLEAGAQWPDPY